MRLRVVLLVSLIIILLPIGVLADPTIEDTEPPEGIAPEPSSSSPLPIPDRNELDSSIVRGIDEWGELLKSQKGDTVTGVRAGISFFGVVLIVYSIGVYLIYWFDVLNIFFSFSVLSVVTFGRLEASGDNEVSTYHSGDKGKRLVVHKDMLKVVILGVTSGVLILSGVVYLFIDVLITTLRVLFRKFGL